MFLGRLVPILRTVVLERRGTIALSCTGRYCFYESIIHFPSLVNILLSSALCLFLSLATSLVWPRDVYSFAIFGAPLLSYFFVFPTSVLSLTDSMNHARYHRRFHNRTPHRRYTPAKVPHRKNSSFFSWHHDDSRELYVLSPHNIV